MMTSHHLQEVRRASIEEENCTHPNLRRNGTTHLSFLIEPQYSVSSNTHMVSICSTVMNLGPTRNDPNNLRYPNSQDKAIEAVGITSKQIQMLPTR